MGFHSKSIRFEGWRESNVLGLKRTGKSCRLRWVNYLNPALKRGKMTTHEQRLVLQLHTKWGNRWSKIAQKLPGRTDNEIKNYWRTHMRKSAQERKKSAVSPSSLSSSSNMIEEIKEPSFYDTGGHDVVASTGKKLDVLTPTSNMDRTVSRRTESKNVQEKEESTKFYSMDEIWKDIESSEENYNFLSQTMASPMWDYCPDFLWPMDEEENKMFLPMSHQLHSFNQNMTG